MSFDDDDANTPKLPLWRTIRQSYASYFVHFPDVLRATLPWLVIGPLAVTGAAWLQLAWMIDAVAEAQRSGKPQMPAMPFVTVLLPHLGYLVLNVGMISIAVAWHRRIIMGERPAPTDVHIVTGRFWRYVGIYLAIFLMCFAMVLVVIVPTFVGANAFGKQFPQVFNAAAILCTVMTVAIAIGVMCRLAPLLPARAIDDDTLTFRETWRRTRGNTWRLFWGIFACSVLPVLPAYFAMLIVIGRFGPDREDWFTHLIVFSALSTVLYILIFPIFIGFLSHAYRHFFEEP